MVQPNAKSGPGSRTKARKPRLNAQERRQHIIEKAAHLVAENGERNVTTRLIAKESGISDALLYQHFPSKDELFREITDILQGKSLSLPDLFLESKPSSRTLMDYLYLSAYVSLHPSLQKQGADLPRLLLESFLGDGALLRTHVNRRWGLIAETFRESLQAAKTAGDMFQNRGEDQADTTLVMEMAHQLIVTIHCFQYLPDKPLMTTALSPDQFVDRVVLFILRGLGFKEAAIKRLYDPEKILLRFHDKLGTLRVDTDR